MRLGILQHYVLGQVLRSFGLVLVTLTSVIVLFMVMAQATREGLSPAVVLRVIPYFIPGMLVYTIPVSLLFAVSVIYGRMGADNEVTAVKAAGQSAWVLLWPSIVLASAASLFICVMSGELIPRASFNFKASIFKDIEDTFFLVLKRDSQANMPGWPVFIGVSDVDVENRVLIDPIFKHRTKGPGGVMTFDATVQAKRAKLRFDLKASTVEITVFSAMLQDKKGNVSYVAKQSFTYPLPRNGPMGPDKKVQEMTSSEMVREKVKLLQLLKQERARQAIAASLLIASGRADRVRWDLVRNAYRDHQRWKRQINELETESQMRIAMGTGGLFFVLLGAPVGILFARRDFLSAFMTCFMPIIVVYYPLVLMGVNLGKEGIVPAVGVWAGNAVLGLVAGFFALPPVLKH